MGIFSVFSAKDIDEFAKSLAEDIAKRYPPDIDNKQSGKVSIERLTRILETTYERASVFQREKRLGLYRKARLMNTFKWTLAELGYTDAFVDVATEGLTVYVTRAQNSPQ